MFSRIHLVMVAVVTVTLLLISACSPFEDSKDGQSSTSVPSSGDATPVTIPPELSGLLVKSPQPTPTPLSSQVSPEDINQAQKMVSVIRQEVNLNYKDKGIVLVSAEVNEFQGGLGVGYVVMFAVPDYFLNPITIAQEYEAEAFQQKANAALVEILKRTVKEVVQKVSSVKTIEIIVIYPNATGVDFVASTDALLTLPDDASNVRWFSKLSVIQLVLVPLQTVQGQSN